MSTAVERSLSACLGIGVLLCPLLAGTAWAGGSETGLPYLTHFSPKRHVQGLGSQYWAVAQTSQGLMYFGNGAGIVEYDGVSWNLIRLPNDGTVRSLAVDADDRIYVGGPGEVGFLRSARDGTMRYVSLLAHIDEDERDFADVWKTHATPQGVFFQAYTHLFRYVEGEGMEVLKPETSFHFSFKVRGQLYVLQREVGLMRFAGGVLRLVPGGQAFAHDRIYAALPYGSIAKSGVAASGTSGPILIATRDRGLFLYDGSAARPWPTQLDPQLRDWRIYHGAVLRDGHFALATNRGGLLMLRPDGSLKLRLSEAEGLPSQAVNYVFEDRQGGLWLALEDQLARVEVHSPLSLFHRPQGLKGAIQSILRHRGVLYLAGTQGVYRLREASHAHNARLDRVSGISTMGWELLAVGDALLVATTDGVYDIRGAEAVAVSQGRASSLTVSRRLPERVYVGLFDGLAALKRRPDGSWEDQGRVAGITDAVRSLAQDEAGHLWLGTQYQGVLRVDLEGDPPQVQALTRYDDGHGWPPGHGAIGVSPTRAGLRFTSQLGVYRYEASRDSFVPCVELGPEFTDGKRWINILREDRQGNLWAFSASDQRPAVARQRKDGSFVWQEQALRRVPTDNLWAIYADEDGVVWFGHADGLIRFDPTLAKGAGALGEGLGDSMPGLPEPGAARAPVLFRRVTTSGGEVLYSSLDSAPHPATATVNSEQSDLRFEFAYPSFDRVEANRFQSYLEGFDEGWSQWNDELTRTYTNLPAGRYRFHLRARGVDARVSEATLALRVLPPWYQTWWAYGIFATLVVGALVLAVQRQTTRAEQRTRREMENVRRLEELEAARRIQRQLLPSTIPRLPGFEIAAFQKTASEVGGDYFDFFPQPGGHLYVAIGDATGHGVAAGLMVTATKTALLTLSQRDLQSAAQRVNAVLKRLELESRLNMALLLVGLFPNPDSNTVGLEVSGGAMAPFYLLRSSGDAEEASVPGLPLGAVSSPSYKLVRRTLGLSDVLVLMSDGLPERVNDHGESLGYEELMRAIRRIALQAARAPALSAQEVLEEVVSVGETWAQGTAPRDDVTVVVIKMTQRRSAG